MNSLTSIVFGNFTVDEINYSLKTSTLILPTYFVNACDKKCRSKNPYIINNLNDFVFSEMDLIDWENDEKQLRSLDKLYRDDVIEYDYKMAVGIYQSYCNAGWMLENQAESFYMRQIQKKLVKYI